MEQEDFEEQAKVGECPVCKAQKDKALVAKEQTLLAESRDRGRILSG